MNSISRPWPNAQWVLDIVGPFPKATRNRRWILVGMDYFTKWVEVEPLKNIQDTDVKRFVWKNIMTQFGVPKVLISDNELQFDNNTLRRYYMELGITNKYSTPSYPQGNRQAEATDKSIVNELKRRLDDPKEKWTDELPSMLWAFRTTSRRLTKEASFSMTYGVEAMIPLKMGLPTS